MDNNQKERLEQELKFLKESLGAGVITNEEYLKGKERIESKLNEPEDRRAEEPKDDISIKELKEITETEDYPILRPQEEPSSSMEKEEKEPEEPGVEEDGSDYLDYPFKEEQLAEEAEESQPEEKEKIEPLETIEYFEDSEKPAEEEPEKDIGTGEEGEEEKSPIKAKKPNFTYLAMILVGIVIFALISITFFKEKGAADTPLPSAGFKALCSSDDECMKEGMIGKCLNPAKEDSACEFIKDAEVEFVIMNDRECASCDTARMVDVIRQLFPAAKYRELDYRDNESKDLLQKVTISALPAYIFSANVAQAYNFNKTERIFVKIGDRYVIAPSASGSNYLFKRERIPGKLELFVLPGEDASLKAEENAKEVIGLFKDKINFIRHDVTDEEKEKLSAQLAVTGYPVFLISNQLKLSGVQPAEVIKQKFCELNREEGCSTTLSLDIN